MIFVLKERTSELYRYVLLCDELCVLFSNCSGIVYIGYTSEISLLVGYWYVQTPLTTGNDNKCFMQTLFNFKFIVDMKIIRALATLFTYYCFLYNNFMETL